MIQLLKSKRYFELFNSQLEFFSADLDNDFFFLNHQKYKDIWIASRQSNLRLLLSHRSCPAEIRLLYINHSNAGVRALAYFGYENNLYYGTSIKFVLSQEANILKDKAFSSVKKKYFHCYFFIKILQLVTSNNSDFVSDYFSTNMIYSHPIQKFNLLISQLECNLHNFSNPSFNQILINNLQLFQNNYRSLDPSCSEIINELVSFTKNPAIGLISPIARIRQLANKFFNNDN